jgi:hypothetical protein
MVESFSQLTSMSMVTLPTLLPLPWPWCTTTTDRFLRPLAFLRLTSLWTLECQIFASEQLSQSTSTTQVLAPSLCRAPTAAAAVAKSQGRLLKRKSIDDGATEDWPCTPQCCIVSDSMRICLSCQCFQGRSSLPNGKHVAQFDLSHR